MGAAEVDHLDVFEGDAEQGGVGQVGVDIAGDQGVCAVTTEHRRVVFVEEEHVVTCAAFERVSAFSTPQGVVALVTFKPVSTCRAQQDVVRCTAPCVFNAVNGVGVA